MKGRNQKAETAPSNIFFRLCHSCLHLNESETEVFRCHRCEVLFDPRAEDDETERISGLDEDLQEFVEEGGVIALRDPEPEPLEEEENEGTAVTENIQGLSVRW